MLLGLTFLSTQNMECDCRLCAWVVFVLLSSPWQQHCFDGVTVECFRQRMLPRAFHNGWSCWTVSLGMVLLETFAFNIVCLFLDCILSRINTNSWNMNSFFSIVHPEIERHLLVLVAKAMMAVQAEQFARPQRDTERATCRPPHSTECLRCARTLGRVG